MEIPARSLPLQGLFIHLLVTNFWMSSCRPGSVQTLCSIADIGKGDTAILWNICGISLLHIREPAVAVTQCSFPRSRFTRDLCKDLFIDFAKAFDTVIHQVSYKFSKLSSKVSLHPATTV